MNFVNDIYNKENDFRFYESRDFQALINKLESVNTSEEILEVMGLMFEFIKGSIGPDNLFKTFKVNSKDSHGKEILLKLNTIHGTLRFEKMLFCEQRETELHTHPEFIVDEILEGFLIENQFSMNDLNFKYSHTVQRNPGHIQKVYDPKGHPHKVHSLKGDCLTVCLYLGHQYVEKVKENLN